MQKMVVIYNNEDLKRLNALFEEGWRLVNMVAAGGGDETSWGTECYVVIEKDTEQN
ncbi:MAG: hypothetical protein ACI4KM_03200 [Oscillospiraceae bacterium]